jgi:hypothetical protein
VERLRDQVTHAEGLRRNVQPQYYTYRTVPTGGFTQDERCRVINIGTPQGVSNYSSHLWWSQVGSKGHGSGYHTGCLCQQCALLSVEVGL